MADFKVILLELLSNIARKLKYEPAETTVKVISSEGANYTSELFEATISAVGKDDLNVFAKVASMSKEIRAMKTGNVYAAEIYVYAELLKKFKDLEARYNVPEQHRLNTPTFYGANDEYMKETLVLENLTLKGYETYDRFKAINCEYASECIKQLAIFQALSIALFKYDPKKFERTKTMLSSVYNFKDLAGMIKGILDNALKIVKPENKARLAAFTQARVDLNDFEEFLKPVKRLVLVHGDYKVSPVDYQAARHGNPITDLLFFIFSGSDKKFRARHFKSSIELYYEELCNGLQRLGVDPNELLPYGLIVGVFILPVVTVEPEKAPKPQKLSDVNIEPNTLYKERLNDIVEDFIEMGVI
ncbi:uncharacterized protein LOC121737436 [Aricia agestis]|uniref:uncharacterized protein LOC121737436 n=1 Tax=Aricia agestis TaxID=91739 RepID=UPI001C204042|nr:uncharacterized protein LOC121737436 [Aricia agestis]